eukprot:745937-Rhodomonas_salina.2
MGHLHMRQDFRCCPFLRNLCALGDLTGFALYALTASPQVFTLTSWRAHDADVFTSRQTLSGTH